MAKRQFYSIKFPFTANKPDNFYLDLETDPYASVKSDITHLLFTPRGSKLRDPKFGAGLITKLFSPIDGITFADIQTEMQTIVSRYFPNITITNLSVTPSEDERGAVVSISYSISEKTYTVNDTITQEF